MEYLSARLSIYIIPPLLSIALGWTLAAVSVVKGRFRTENILFSLICLWWTLMPLVFLSHHIFKGNIPLIMTIERSFHFVYVYMPPVILLYLQKSFSLNKKYLVVASLVLSIIISIFVPTKYYISGLYTYNWGYSAKGEIAFKIFGISAMAHLLYFIWFFIEKMKNVKNYTERLKLKYILLSFIASALLTILNIPAINGIDFYAYGNFMFIPLTLIAYGVLRYRLMEIKSVLHITMIWGTLSSLILIPNIIIVYFVKPHMNEINDATFFLISVTWFILNYSYFKKIKPVIDRVFNKQKFNLNKAAVDFSENISFLKTLDKLIEVFEKALLTNLNFRSILFFIRVDEGLFFRNLNGETCEINRNLYDWFISDDRYLEHDMIKTNPYYSSIIASADEIFKKFNCSYILPLVRNNEMISFTLSGERLNLRNINRNEASFLESVKRSMAISISNSVMYQKLSDLKDNLEAKVAQRTEELLKAMEGVEAANIELLTANDELNEARRIAEIDMMMAAHVQKSIFPEIPSYTSKWDIAAAFIPMSMVSGDLYDFYLNENDLQGLILLDVSGHGIASGLITMIARSVFNRNFFSNRDMNLGKIVENANKELISEMGNTDKFLTGNILRFEDDYVEYVNAGHLDLMLKKNGSDQVKIINPPDMNFKGSILGVSEMDFPYKSAKFKTDSGDLIVIFSDGIIEAIGTDNTRFGIKRIAKRMMDSDRLTSSEILNGITDDFYKFIGGEKLKDDITVIVLKKK